MGTGHTAHKWQLKQLTFTRHKTVNVVIDKICVHMADQSCVIDHEWLALVRHWLLTPYSLWPNDFKGLGEEICRQLDAVKKIDDEIIAILNLLRELPSRKAQEMVAEVEKNMKEGNYDFCLTSHAMKKFTLHETELLEDLEWLQDWKAFTDRYDVENKYDKYGLLRRTLSMERNFHPDSWAYKGGSADENFQNAVDALCHKYELYGVLRGKPLLMKLSINPTPFGTLMFLPVYWNMDSKRDIRWKVVTDMQKARGTRRHRTDKLELQKQNTAKRNLALNLKREAEAKGLGGRDKHEYICHGMKISIDTDERTVRRWSEEAEKLGL